MREMSKIICNILEVILSRHSRTFISNGAVYWIRHISTNQILERNTNTTDNEIAHHSKLADQWWDTNGYLKALHSLNEIRVPFIREGLISRGNIDCKLIGKRNVLKDQNILEVGCGGGILTESLARLGANVTGIDLSEELLNTAKQHLAETADQALTERITYNLIPLEDHTKTHLNHYDAVIVSEVLEHVDNKMNFINSCAQNLKAGGSIFITTLNQSCLMWFGGIILAEYVLNLVPKNTHHWNKLITPIDIERMLKASGCETVLINGTIYDFWRNSWRWINSTQMCYVVQAIKVDQ